MQFDRILTHNRDFVARRAAAPLPGAVNLPLAVVACYDPRLDALLHEALGVAPTEAFLFRVAGALLRPDSNSLRSLANSVYFFGVSEVLVVGHSSCRMAAFSANDYIAAFRARGVAREAFGPSDLRDWAGAIPSPGGGVRRSLDAMATAPYLPRDLVTSGVVLDDTTGALEVVSRPATLAERNQGGVSAVPDTAAGVPAFAAAPAPEAVAPGTGRAERSLNTPSDAIEHLAREIADMREMVRLLEGTSGWREELKRVRDEVGRQRNPLRKLQVVEEFVKRATVNARELQGSFERLRKESTQGVNGFDLDRLIALFLKSTRSPEA